MTCKAYLAGPPYRGTNPLDFGSLSRPFDSIAFGCVESHTWQPTSQSTTGYSTKPSKRAVTGPNVRHVNEALREYVERRQQAKILEAFGTIDIDPDYDYKQQRRRA